MKFLKTIVTITILIFAFDLLINLILPQSIKKKIGTSRNYSLKSTKFHHKTAPEINVNEFWGKKKYRVKTNEYSMRINEKEDFKVNKENKYVGFVGDSFVYGSGIDYEDHFISKLQNENYNYLNLGYVSYSPSIYFKIIENLLLNEKLKFKSIFLFIDHSDIQDEGQFYREDANGNIVRKWLSDEDIKSKNRKYKIKNYFKQNSFIFKLYDNISAPSISNNAERCINDGENIKEFKQYLDINRFGYSYINKINSQNWVQEGSNKVLLYLDKIELLSEKHDFNIIIVYYPSALEVIDNIIAKNSKHFNLLKEWSQVNEIPFINTSLDFIDENNKDNYLSNFIKCDVHWNKKGHKIIAKYINKFLNENNF